MNQVEYKSRQNCSELYIVWEGLMSLLRLLTSVLVSAALFAGTHFQLVQFPALFVVGAVFATVTFRSNGLGLPIAVHMGFNATTVVLLAM